MVIQKWAKYKKWIFSKNCLALFVSGREKKRTFSCTLSVLAKHVFGPKQSKPGKTIKKVVSVEIAQNQKWRLFLGKVFSGMGEKVGFTNYVFEQLCSSENTIYSAFNKTLQLQWKTVCWKNRKYMNTSGLCLNMARRCFCLFFEV